MDDIKHVILAIESLEGGGAERVVINLSKGLIKKGIYVNVIIFNSRFDYKLNFDLQVHQLKMNCEHYPRYLSALKFRSYARQFVKLVKKLETQYGKAGLILSNLTKSDRILCNIIGYNVYFCIHNTISYQEFLNKSRFQTWRRQLKYKNIYDGKNLIAVSDGVAKDFVEEVNIKPLSIRTIYNPFDISEIRQLANEPLPYVNEEYIVHVGSFKKQKRHDLLIKAFAQAKLPCKLVLVGQGTTKEEQFIRDIVSKKNIEGKVIFGGFQPNPYPWIKQSKFLVLNSDYEGLSNVIIEALICGVPVVSTDCKSGPREILVGELQNGLVAVNNIDALASKLQEFYFNRFQVKNSQLSRFSSENIVEEYLKLH